MAQLYSSDTILFKGFLDDLLEHYAKIQDGIHLEYDESTPKNCVEIAPVKSFQKREMGIDWAAVISHVFFKFFSLGGKDYYGFCEHCGQFYVAQRKSRKRFCQDTCRVMNHLEKVNKL